jgi:hypothetical protein
MKLWCDNKSAINIANNPVQHDRAKYMEIDRFFIKEKLNNGLLELGHVATREQVTDYLIKEFSPLDLIRLCDKMDLIDFFAHLERECVDIYLNVANIYEYQLEISNIN